MDTLIAAGYLVDAEKAMKAAGLPLEMHGK
jgi:hypothetical protein